MCQTIQKKVMNEDIKFIFQFISSVAVASISYGIIYRIWNL